MWATSRSRSVIGLRAGRVGGLLGWRLRLACLFFALELLQNLLDAILRGDRLIEEELDLRRTPQRQAGAEEMAHERRRPRQRFGGLLALRGVAHRRPVHACEREIRCDLDACDGNQPDTRVRHLGRKDLADLFPDLFGDSFDAVGKRHFENRYEEASETQTQ